MASQTYFYNELFKKAVNIFGSRFNDIEIKRESSDGDVSQTLSVPIQYAPIQKYLARIQADKEAKRQSNIILPRMSFEITNIQRDTSRGIGATTKIKTPNGYIFTSVPYNLSFQLNIISNTMEDSTKIVEQILPRFNPKLAISAKLIDGVDEKFDIPLVLDSVTLQDTYDGDFNTRRVIIWQLDFTMFYRFFGPQIDSGVIKFVKTNINSDNDMKNLDYSLNVKPGLTANGEPTSNSNNSIEYDLINSDDDFGFIVEKIDN